MKFYFLAARGENGLLRQPLLAYPISGILFFFEFLPPEYLDKLIFLSYVYGMFC